MAWSKVGGGTRNVRLVARGFPRGTAVELRCSGGGCPSKTVRRTVRRTNENLHGPFGNRVLRRGARVEVRITSANRSAGCCASGSARRAAAVDFLCLPPGGGTRDC